MTEHYTRNTTDCLAWCEHCRRLTQHRVDGGRRGPCLEHETPVRAKIPPLEKQKTLFGDLE
jgi:hypothetical protein